MRKFDLNEPDRLIQHLFSKGKMVGDCFEWQGTRHTFGYGNQYVNGKIYTVPRLVWILFHGPIPDSMHVLHQCDNPPCFLLSHLELGTHDDNMRQRDAKFRYRHGQDNNTTKLTDEQVREIYSLKGKVTQRGLALMYGVNQRAIWNILNHKGWKHLKLKG